MTTLSFNSVHTLTSIDYERWLVRTIAIVVIASVIFRRAIVTFFAIVAFVCDAIAKHYHQSRTATPAQPEPPETELPETAPPADDPLSELTRQELMTMAGTKSRLNKAQLVKKIRSSQ